MIFYHHYRRRRRPKFKNLENHLKIYPENPAKSFLNLHFLSKNPINLSKSFKKSHDFADHYLTANTFLSVKELRKYYDSWQNR